MTGLAPVRHGRHLPGMPRDRADVRLDVSVGTPVESRVPEAESDGGGRAVAIVGDLSGRDGRPPDPDDIRLAERRLIPIDRDVLGDVLADLAPRAIVDLGIAGAAPFALTFRSLDDFHPDHLLDRVPLLTALEGRAPAPERPQDAPVAEAPPPGGLLDRILDAKTKMKETKFIFVYPKHEGIPVKLAPFCDVPVLLQDNLISETLIGKINEIQDMN